MILDLDGTLPDSRRPPPGDANPERKPTNAMTRTSGPGTVKTTSRTFDVVSTTPPRVRLRDFPNPLPKPPSATGRLAFHASCSPEHLSLADTLINQ